MTTDTQTVEQIEAQVAELLKLKEQNALYPVGQDGKAFVPR